MSLAITTDRSELLAEARAEYTRAEAQRATVTGEQERPVPPDAVLIATDPVLSAEIQAAEAAATVTLAAASTAASTGASGTSGQLLNIVG